MENEIDTSQDNYITKTQLKERGWTDKLIKDFYPVPTHEKPSKSYKNRISKLYDKKQVMIIEQSEDFKLSKEKVLHRQKSASKAVKTKTDKTISNTLTDININYSHNLDYYIKYAIKSYNEHNWEKNNNASLDSDKEFIHRITVNYL